MPGTKKQRVLDLHRRKWSTHDIAAATEMTPKAVNRILRDAGELRPKEPPLVVKTTVREDMAMMTRTFKKCPECGKRVQMPCLECKLTAS